jgi:hypothetical protein
MGVKKNKSVKGASRAELTNTFVERFVFLLANNNNTSICQPTSLFFGDDDWKMQREEKKMFDKWYGRKKWQ